MRKGSTFLGSLAWIPAGISLLILPLCGITLGVVLGPTAAMAEGTSVSQRRCSRVPSWLSASRRSGTRAARRVRPVRIVHTKATWYGPGFHGRRTASGERFNRNAMTLASRHLPFGTRVRVVNVHTGLTAEARVNDRGPFGKSGYTADLSQGLARRIGLRGSGPIRLEILPKSK